ncbi:hypothetical protein C8Q73DRAFT_788185 [Cubamyces lactineus]|nr:hypothetical protein C8Q73DRAFT_788185 [Cubamyces lactineus]
MDLDERLSLPGHNQPPEIEAAPQHDHPARSGLSPPLFGPRTRHQAAALCPKWHTPSPATTPSVTLPLLRGLPPRPRGFPQPSPRLLPASGPSRDRYRPPLSVRTYTAGPTCDANGPAPPDEPSMLVLSEHASLVWGIVDPAVEVTGTTACFGHLTTSRRPPVTGQTTHHIGEACAPTVLGSSVALRVLAPAPSFTPTGHGSLQLVLLDTNGINAIIPRTPRVE